MTVPLMDSRYRNVSDESRRHQSHLHRLGEVSGGRPSTRLIWQPVAYGHVPYSTVSLSVPSFQVFSLMCANSQPELGIDKDGFFKERNQLYVLDGALLRYPRICQTSRSWLRDSDTVVCQRMCFNSFIHSYAE